MPGSRATPIVASNGSPAEGTLNWRDGEHVVWFFGTALDTPWVAIPRVGWKLPWHRTSIRFDVEYNGEEERYRKYRMEAAGRWGGAELDLVDSGEAPTELEGFPDVETGEVILTHPMKGYYRRRNGSLGSYQIWHDRLRLHRAEARTARFDLLDTLGLVKRGDLSTVQSVMVARRGVCDLSAAGDMQIARP